MPLSPLAPAEPSGDDASLPIAIACLADGHDARSCPKCSRVFFMRPEFQGKVIRCRGCKDSFRVAATQASPKGPAVSSVLQQVPQVSVDHDGMVPVDRTYDHVSDSQPKPNQESLQAEAVPCVFEDIGDVLDEILPGEHVASVVRPQNVPYVPPPARSLVSDLIGMVLGGIVSLPLTQMIVWWGLRRDPLGIAEMLPEALRWLAPDQLGR